MKTTPGGTKPDQDESLEPLRAQWKSHVDPQEVEHGTAALPHPPLAVFFPSLPSSGVTRGYTHDLRTSEARNERAATTLVIYDSSFRFDGCSCPPPMRTPFTTPFYSKSPPLVETRSNSVSTLSRYLFLIILALSSKYLALPAEEYGYFKNHVKG